MPTVAIHPPKTPVTTGSMGIASNTVPNVCKMPGPPAPFVPTPLPNMGKSGNNPTGYSTTVKVEGNAVAIRGATFDSIGDVASKGTGGGLISMNTQGPTKFIGPGSMTVKFDGGNVHLLGEPMLNNCGPGGSPPNAATMSGLDQADGSGADANIDPCTKIKLEFNLVTGTHADNEDRKSVTNQSHHVLQDEALKGRGVPTNDGFAVLLADSHRGTEHRIITNLQNARRDNKRFDRAGTLPASTFGVLKTQARSDLVAGLAGNRTNDEGRAMTSAEAEVAADCLVTEAEKAAKKAAKANGKKLNDDSRVDQPGGCFAAGTRVRLASGELRAVECLRRGDRVRTLTGDAEVVRLDRCHHRLVELVVGDSVVVLAAYHRLFDEAGCAVRADTLRPGDRVATVDGARPIARRRHVPEPRPIYRIGLAAAAACILEEAGLLAEVTDAGPPVARAKPVEPFRAGAD
jgi:hypothetical protein